MKIFFLIILLILVIGFFINIKNKEKFNLSPKKKCLLGLVGLYRTFEKTSKNIYQNIIKNNPNYEFTIIINTDLANEDLKKINKRDSRYKKIFYPKNILETKLKKIYNKFGNLKKIIYFSNNGKYKSGVFGIRIKQILEHLENTNDENYDMCIFLRLDAIINNQLNLNKFNSKTKIFTITNTNYNYFRKDHATDWDYLYIGNYKLYKIYFYYSNNPPKLKYKNLSKPISQKLIELTGNNGTFLKNYDTNKNYTLLPKNNVDYKLYRGWLKIYNLYKLKNIILSFKNPQNINSELLRNYGIYNKPDGA